MTERSASPLDGVAYASADEFDLVRLRASPTDARVSAFVTTFAASDDDARAACRALLTPAQFDTLLTFARRQSVQALRTADPSPAFEALVGLAAIDASRFDYRDLSWAVGLAQHAVWVLGADVDSALTRAASLADEKSRPFFTAHVGVPEDRRTLQAQGFRAIQTDRGLGLIEDWGKRYQPTVDLAAVAVAIADALAADGYATRLVAAGSDIADDWLRSGDPGQVRADLRAVRACHSVHGHLPPPARQMLLAFVAECDHPDVAERLSAAAAPAPSAHHRAIAVNRGPLVCIVIGQAAVAGTESTETEASMQRFVPRIRQALAAAKLRED